MYSANIQKLERSFLPKDFTITTWEVIQPYFDNLLQRDIDGIDSLKKWLKDSSELEAAISEDACWRQIKMTCDTTNKSLEEAFAYFCTHIQPPVSEYADRLNRKLMASPYTKELPQEEYYTFLRNIAKSIELFNEKNIPIQSELSIEQQQFGAITGAMTVSINEQEYTLQQASKFLENEHRPVRENAYRAIQDRRLQSKDDLNVLFDKLLIKREQLAQNSGCANYIEYRFKELGRFDYTPDDCKQFNEGVKQYVIPIVDKIYQQKKEKLGLAILKPWDTEAEPAGTKALQPFTNGHDLLQKSISCFELLNPFFADCLRKMDNLNHFDLESRKGKAPGGYNCPLAETGAPFIFMNAAGQMDDVTTMVHEGGHAVHSFLAHSLSLNGFKEYPMEIAEVASMAMELFSMDYWHVFFNDKEELKRAQLHQLERVITIFPWIATIDSFQHWIYTHPGHSVAQREAAWVQILNEYKSNVLDYTGLEHYRMNAWQRQLHLYEVPFYYIEYGIAQLGAIGMYQQYKRNPKQAIENYCKALALGATKTLPELYKTAGLEFDFSPLQIKGLMEFIWNEMEAIKNN